MIGCGIAGDWCCFKVTVSELLHSYLTEITHGRVVGYRIPNEVHL